MITRILIDESAPTGVYYDDEGQPTLASALVRDTKFTSRVVAETRELLSMVPKQDAHG